MKYLIKIKYKDKFVGYIKNYRLHRNCKYRFNKTKNIKKSMFFDMRVCSNILDKLQTKIDNLYYKNYSFEIYSISKKDIRKSKLQILKNKKIKNGILKNK